MRGNGVQWNRFILTAAAGGNDFSNTLWCSVRLPFILYPAPNRSGPVRAQNGNPDVFSSRVYCQKCPFSHGRMRNLLFRTEAGVYRKKILPCTLPGVPRGHKNRFFPHIRVYTEKLSLHIPFFAISRVLTHNFSVYALLPRTNRAKRGELAKQRGIAEQLFYIYPAGSNNDQNRPTCAGGRCQTATAPRENCCRIWTASISRFVGGQSGVM